MIELDEQQVWVVIIALCVTLVAVVALWYVWLKRTITAIVADAVGEIRSLSTAPGEQFAPNGHQG